MTLSRLVLAAIGGYAACFGCSKPAPIAEAQPSASASPVAPPPTPTVLPNSPVAWSGSYSSAPGSLYVYDGGEWKGVHFRGDDASVGLGDGPLSLTIDPKSGQLRGNASGPLGEVMLSGALTADELSFSVSRKDPLDHGLTGTGAGRITGATATGTIRLSRGDAHVIREATFSLTRKLP